MAVQPGSYTAMAVMTGNPYIIAAGVVLDIVQGRRNQKQQEKHLEAVRDAEVIRATYENRQLNLQQQQFDAQASDQKIVAQVAALQAADRSQLSAGENGVSGFSVARITDAIFKDGSAAVRNINTNLANSRAQLTINKQAANRRVLNSVNGLPTASGPDLLGIALEAGMGLYKTNQANKAVGRNGES